jgi:polyribonucleotide 5'-hydroxyl-kinase
LNYFHGHTAADKNVELYKNLVANLASRVEERLACDQAARASGIVVNTCGWIDGEGFNVLMHALDAFKIDIVLVIGHDKLYSTFLTALKGRPEQSVTVVKLQRSGGVVMRVRFLLCRIPSFATFWTNSLFFFFCFFIERMPIRVKHFVKIE